MALEEYIFSKEKKPFFLIAGPCALESEKHVMRMAGSLVKMTEELGLTYVFKVSWDKANRSSAESYRGHGLEEGLRILSRVKKDYGIPCLTDIHESSQAAPVGEVVDILQIPAFLCRQTDLVVSAARTGKIVNIKKGQFISPYEMENITDKAQYGGNDRIIITERGYSFGYNNLVVDFRAFPIMRHLEYPLVFDATHSIQLPGARGRTSSGNPEFAYDLARAAVGVGVDGLFFEVHDDPMNALSDRENQVPLRGFKEMLQHLMKIDQAVKGY